MNETWERDLLLWFVTTMVQVTVIALAVILCARLARSNPAIRHGILTAGLTLIAISPLSTYCLQQSRCGLYTVASEPAQNTSMQVLAEWLKSVDTRAPADQVGTGFTAGNPERTDRGSGTIDPVTSNAPADEPPGTAHSLPPSFPAAVLRDRGLPEGAGDEAVDAAERYAFLPRAVLCLCAVWLLGCVLAGIRLFVALTRLARIVRNSISVSSGGLDEAYTAACCAMGCEESVASVLVSDSVVVPIVAGVFRPTIVLPTSLVDRLSAEQLTEVLIHELAHIVRHDQIVNVLQILGGVLFWAHPLVRSVIRRLAQAREEICDNFVLLRKSKSSYSRTLLSVAELSADQANVLGAIGVVGSGWSLTKRIAGLLDQRRCLVTHIERKAKMRIALLTGALSLVLCATVTFQDGLAVAQNADATEDLSALEAARDWVRGDANNLEFRLRGKLIGGIGGPPVDPQVEILVHQYPLETLTFPATIENDTYEAWIPARSLRWFSFDIIGRSGDGRMAVTGTASTKLRSVLIRGLDLEFLRPARTVTFRVMHEQEPVAGAHVKAWVLGHETGGLQTQTLTDEDGKATLRLIAGSRLLQVTAWSDSGLLGRAYEFINEPDDVVEANEHVIELVKCKERKIHVVDASGAPAAGVRLRLDVMTQRPQFSHFGLLDGCDVLTDETGTAIYRWYPQVEDATSRAELTDNHWVLKSQDNTGEVAEVAVARPAERERVEGAVTRDGKFAGGILIEILSFQAETKGSTDLRHAMTDEQGRFAFDALHDSTYCIFVCDERLVSEPVVFTAWDPTTGKTNSPRLTAVDGHKVTVQVTSAADGKPVAGQEVSLNSPIEFSWTENGERRQGSSRRPTWVVTDEAGSAVAYAPPGRLEVETAMTSQPSKKSIDVKPNDENRIELRQEAVVPRDKPVAKEVVGRLVAPEASDVDLASIKICIRTLDGEIDEPFTPTPDRAGTFRFSTAATAVGCFATTEDRQLAGTALFTDLSQPMEVSLLPAGYLTGQVFGPDGKGLANYSITATGILVNDAVPSKITRIAPVMNGASVETKTDSEGRYRIGPLPRLTRIYLVSPPTEETSQSDGQFLGRYFIEKSEERPPIVHRLGQPAATATNLTPKERVTSLLRDAGLGGYHVMVLLADYSDKPCSEFVEDHLLDYSQYPNVASYMQVRLNTGSNGNAQSVAYATEKQWPIPPAGSVAAVAMDAKGNELGRAMIVVSSDTAKGEAATFVESHLPPVVDGDQKWKEAFALARQTNRRVWVRISGRYCGPCVLLSRWLDDHGDLLAKEFVMLKIEEFRDLHGQELAEKLTRGRSLGIPFFAFFDQDEQLLIDSCGPMGNMGFMQGYESKRYFRHMLEVARQNLTDDDIDRLLNTLED